MKATSLGLGKRGQWRWPLDLTCLVCPVPNTYVGMRSCIPTMIWWWCGGSAISYPDEVLGSTPKTWLNGLALSHLSRLTLLGAPKILLYCTKYRRPTTQMEADPFKDLQGVSRKGPRGLTRESFNDCIMFHLLTVFPNNPAEQENTTFPTCSRSPRGLAYISLYSM